MSGGSNPSTALKKLRAILLWESLRVRNNQEPKEHVKFKGAKWYWFTGVPEKCNLQNTESANTEGENIRGVSSSDAGNNAQDEVNWKLNVKALFAGFSNLTTSHGISHIYFSKGIIKKVGWSLLSLICLCLLLAHLTYLIANYKSHAVTTNVEMIAERSIPFPAVTICNNNAIKKSKVPRTMTGMMDAHKERFTNDSNKELSEFETLAYITEEFATMNEQEKKTTGYSREEMIIYCLFNGENCSNLNFWSFHDSVHGNCYTFNSGKESDEKLGSSNLPGPKHGLRLIVNIGVYEYIPFVTDDAGVRVVVHSQDSMPFPSLTGMSAAPGQTTNIAVHKSRVTRLGKPFGNCTSLDMNSENAFAEFYGVGYSEWACLNTCYQKHVVKMCGCFDPSIPYSNKSDVFNDVPFVSYPCRTKNNTEKTCTEKTMLQFSKQRLRCPSCFQQCNQSVYDTYLSTALFPAISYLDDFISYLNMSHHGLYSKLTEVYPTFPAVQDKPIYSNFLKLNVFYQELMYTQYTQVPVYDTSQFVSDLGGTFGLWIGWSVMTAFEFVGLLSDLCVYLFYKQQQQRQQQQ